MRVVKTFVVGDLERLRRYWMTGTCKPGREVQKSSDPLTLEQFLSAFLLLMMGIILAAAFLLLEHLYFKYVRQRLARSDGGGSCALFSLVSFYFIFPTSTRIQIILYDRLFTEYGQIIDFSWRCIRGAGYPTTS